MCRATADLIVQISFPRADVDSTAADTCRTFQERATWTATAYVWENIVQTSRNTGSKQEKHEGLNKN